MTDSEQLQLAMRFAQLMWEKWGWPTRDNAENDELEDVEDARELCRLAEQLGLEE